MGQAFWFKIPSSILVVDPSDCGKTCLTESLLLHHSQTSCSKIHPRPLITVTVRGKMVSLTCKGLACNFIKGFPTQTMSSRGFLIEGF